MPKEPTIREWTVIFCFASDNPLAPGTISQLKAIKNAGYHPEVNVIAQFDPNTVNTPVHVFDVNLVEKLKDPGNANIGFPDDSAFVRNLVLDKLWDAEVRDQIRNRAAGIDARTGVKIDYDPPIPPVTMSIEQNPKESLASLLEFCRVNYPARHYILIILAHGIVVGNDLFMLDEHGASDSPQRALTLTDLGEVLDKFRDKISGDESRGELELVGFHSCSMSGAEVAFELKGKANYMLASEGPLYVGSWPYRQMLIRLFNEMEFSRPLSDHSMAGGLVNRIKTGVDEPATHLRRSFNGNGGKLLQKHRVGDSPNPKLVDALAEKLEKLIKSSALSEVKAFQNGNLTLSKDTKKLLRQNQKGKLGGEALKRLNRGLIVDAFPEEIEKVRIRRMFINFFEYCIYNSFDFQLAGYSSDLTLCDLNRVHQLQQPLTRLAKTLRDGLEHVRNTGDSSIREAILLAHWEAQSFYEENYTDLYDFCFRLAAKRNTVWPKSKATRSKLEEIFSACDGVMNALKRGVRNHDFGSIVRCEFCGPMYQYSHGLSVFFPWSEPVGNQMWDKEYEHYELHQRTKWKGFLKVYFDETMRLTQQEERDRREKRNGNREKLDKALLQMLEHMAGRVFTDAEQLKGGPRDPLGSPKGGGSDPTGGGGCECSFKNYPPMTRRLAGQIAGVRRGKGANIAPLASTSIVTGLQNQFSRKVNRNDLRR